MRVGWQDVSQGLWGWNLRKIRDRRNNRILISQESFTKIESILLQMSQIITLGPFVRK